jgi:hypothetical protein
MDNAATRPSVTRDERGDVRRIMSVPPSRSEYGLESDRVPRIEPPIWNGLEYLDPNREVTGITEDPRDQGKKNRRLALENLGEVARPIAKLSRNLIP